MQPTIKLPATYSFFRPLKNGCIKLFFETQEVGTEQVDFFLRYKEAFGYLVFAPVEITEIEIPDRLEVPNKKTKSQIQRNVIYRMWERSLEKEKGMSSGDYYDMKMDKIIEWLKSKLE